MLSSYFYRGPDSSTVILSFQRKVLEALRHLRIEKVRVKPLESAAPIRGGKADVEAAILTLAEPSKSPELDDVEYIAVKKVRSDMETGDDQALTVSPFWAFR